MGVKIVLTAEMILKESMRDCLSHEKRWIKIINCKTMVKYVQEQLSGVTQIVAKNSNTMVAI